MGFGGTTSHIAYSFHIAAAAAAAADKQDITGQTTWHETNRL